MAAANTAKGTRIPPTHTSRAVRVGPKMNPVVSATTIRPRFSPARAGSRTDAALRTPGRISPPANPRAALLSTQTDRSTAKTITSMAAALSAMPTVAMIREWPASANRARVTCDTKAATKPLATMMPIPVPLKPSSSRNSPSTVTIPPIPPAVTPISNWKGSRSRPRGRAGRRRFTLISREAERGPRARAARERSEQERDTGPSGP